MTVCSDLLLTAASRSLRPTERRTSSFPTDKLERTSRVRRLDSGASCARRLGAGSVMESRPALGLPCPPVRESEPEDSAERLCHFVSVVSVGTSLYGSVCLLFTGERGIWQFSARAGASMPDWLCPSKFQVIIHALLQVTFCDHCQEVLSYRGQLWLIKAAVRSSALSRSLRDLVSVLEELRQKDCDLYIHKQAIDTTTSSGKLLFQMLSVFAEFERELIRERVIAGQQRARRQGKRIGRRTVIDESLKSEAARLRFSGLSLRDIGARLEVSAATVLKALG